eukprot:gene31896-42548_t
MLDEPDISKALRRLPPYGRELVRLPWNTVHPIPEALRAIEGMLGKVAGQVYEGESRTRETLAAVEARLAKVESAETPGVDPAQLAEVVVARVEEAEGRTTDALRDLGASFVALDRRLRTVESGAGDGGARLESLAADLTRRMEATRAEMASNLQTASASRFDRMERKLSEMAAHIQTAETRSAQAIERMGREGVSMADSLSRRVQTVENHGADAIEQIGGEVARIATVVKQKRNRADGVQAQAREKLGGEIARITERLAERIANSERRGALAIDEVGEQVARVTERINQRQERSSADLAERIRQSEERTARLLDEAREKIDQSLNASPRGHHRPLGDLFGQGPVMAPVAPAARRAETPREPFGDPFASEPFPSPGRTIPEEAFAPQALTRPTTGATPPLVEPLLVGIQRMECRQRGALAKPGIGGDFAADQSTPATNLLGAGVLDIGENVGPVLGHGDVDIDRAALGAGRRSDRSANLESWHIRRQQEVAL